MPGYELSDRQPSLPDEALRAAIEGVASVPLHRFLGLDIVSVEPGRALARIRSTDNALNNKGVLHGGVVNALLDVTAYLAILPLLEPGENAVTHDIHVSVMRFAPAERSIDLRGSVTRRGRSLIFADSVAWDGDRQLASARVTKSVVDER